MTSIWDYNKTPTSNTGSPPTGFGTGQAPSNVRVMLQDILGEVTEFVNSTVAAGSADALTVTFTNAPAAPSTLVDGMEIHVRAAAANATTTPTLAVNGGTARTITKLGGAALAAGDIAGNLHELLLRYNLANTRWELLNPAKASAVVLTGSVNEISTTLASAATVNIGAAAANYIFISGVTTITAFDTIASGAERTLEFQGVLILTNNATTLILPGGANITTAAGDTAIFRSEGAGNWRCISYQKASAAPVTLSPITNSLGADVALNNVANFFTGPSVAQGSAGIWSVSGTVTLVDTAGSALFNVKLWDGTTVIASAQVNSAATGALITVSLSGFLSAPAGNLRISAQDTTSTSGAIKFNASGNSKDSTITAIRIA